MKEERKISVGQIMESVFEIGYLLFDLIAFILFISQSQGRQMFILYAFLTLFLGTGDAFHLVPRIKRSLRGEDSYTEYTIGLGLMISSITMTIFYMILFVIRTMMGAPIVPFGLQILIVSMALLRIVLCLFPQNNWFHKEGNMKWSFFRNVPFTIVGICMIYLFATMHTSFGNQMAAAIFFSFLCYLPVTIWSKTHPKVGLLMIPKTCMYIWMICLGLQLL